MITAVLLFYSNCYYTAVVGCSYYCYSKNLLCGGLLDAWGGMCARARLCKTRICFICDFISVCMFFSAILMFSVCFLHVFFCQFHMFSLCFFRKSMFLSTIHMFFRKSICLF